MIRPGFKSHLSGWKPKSSFQTKSARVEPVPFPVIIFNMSFVLGTEC
jgi:hypothetical protein